MTANITLIGTVATDPKLYRFENGGVRASFRLARSERWLDRATNSWVDGNTSWFTVYAGRSFAEHVMCSLKKGDRVILSGRLRVRKWELDDGRSGTSAEVEVDGIGHDLRFGTSSYRKANAADAMPYNDTDAPPVTGSVAVSQAGWHNPQIVQQTVPDSPEQLIAQEGKRTRKKAERELVAA